MGPVQQCPVPLMPQIPDVQLSSEVQLPVAWGTMQAPALQTNPLAQSAVFEQRVRHVVADLSQARFCGHMTTAPERQLPAPSHEGALLSIAALQDGRPQTTVVAGYTHSPRSSHAVAPHELSLVEQATLQQLPRPLIPQDLDWHCALSVQAVPLARPLEPPLVTPPAVPLPTVVPPLLEVLVGAPPWQAVI